MAWLAFRSRLCLSEPVADLDDFEASLRDAAMGLRRIPKELRKELSVRDKPEIAVPLAAKIASGWSGPWGPALAGATKARAGADPTIVVGGAKAVVSGGASARQLVYGVEWGANANTVRTVNRQKGRGNSGRGRVTARERAAAAAKGQIIFKRHSTRQFVGKRAPSVFPTIRSNGGWIMDKFATIVDDVLSPVMARD